MTAFAVGSLRITTIALAVSCFAPLACTRKPPDLAKVRPVMEKLLEAERDHRGSHGTYWRSSQPKVDRDELVRNLGIDLSDAGDFEFTIEPREDGMDTVLRVTTRGTGAGSNVSLSCVQPAAQPKADCKESTGGS